MKMMERMNLKNCALHINKVKCYHAEATKH